MILMVEIQADLVVIVEGVEMGVAEMAEVATETILKLQ